MLFLILIMNPLQHTPDPSNATPCLRNVFLKLVALNTVCATESKDYCDFCANKVERCLLPVIFVSYAVVVAVIFAVAQATSTSNIDNHFG
jgi:hypothetical protein